MFKNKKLLLILILIALISIGVMGAINYSSVPKKYLPIAIEPTFEPSVTPIITSTPTITSAVNCPSFATDIDGNIYKTVQIGSQCWLKENLKVTKNPEGNAITRYCYDNDPKICDTDGGLYDWNTAMNNSTAEGAQGICPTGWHVPKDSEWYVLESGLAAENCSAERNGSGCEPAGTVLKKGSTNGFDSTFAGYRDPNSLFYNREMNIFLWSSTENDFKASSRTIDQSISAVGRFLNDKMLAFSLHCLKD